MAGLITHYICADSVLGEINPNARQTIEKNRSLYNIGAQGPDIFFYYLPGLFKKSIRGLGGKMHNGNFSVFLSAICGGLNGLSPATKEKTLSYAYGYLTHYAMDCACHPYVYYRSGFRKKGRVRSIKYSVNHRNLETNIDVLMLKIFSGEKPASKKLWRLMRAKSSEARGLTNVLSVAINKAYGVSLSPKNINAAFKYMSRVTRLLQSFKGRRKEIIGRVEEGTVGQHILSSLIHPQFADERIDFMNVEKENWLAPWDKNDVRNDSFAEMFETAVKDSAAMINALCSFAGGGASLEELLSVTGDRSFSTGLDASEKAEFKFYDLLQPKEKRE